MLMAIGIPFLGWRDRGRPTINQGDPARAEKESLSTKSPGPAAFPHPVPQVRERHEPDDRLVPDVRPAGAPIPAAG